MPTTLITGANRGIGLELVRAMLARGYDVLATGRDPERADALNALAGGGRLEVLPLEVTGEASMTSFVDRLGDRTIDVLVNNAGVKGGERQSAATGVDLDDWAEVLAVNTLAPVRLTLALRQNLARAERPRVVTISSQMGSLAGGGRGWIAYRSSKAAVNMAMRNLAEELGDEGIIVVPVHPGWVRTDMGGEQAPLSPAESAAGLAALIDGLTPEHSGRFWDWDGQERSW
jgi:NAD(P)-dependent dehydrogenase (short-subunit alcohol dehydrogenase family)